MRARLHDVAARYQLIGYALALAAAGLLAGCDRVARDDVPPPRSAAAAPPQATAASPAPVHGNHDPKYGGVVLMNGDLHFEVVLTPAGRYHVYFSDAARAELPASVASQVTLT